MINLILYTIIILGWSNIVVDLLGDFDILQFKPLNCRPCLAAWLGILIALIAYPFGSIELLVLPAIGYFINKLKQNELL